MMGSSGTGLRRCHLPLVDLSPRGVVVAVVVSSVVCVVNILHLQGLTLSFLYYVKPTRRRLWWVNRRAGWGE